MYIAHCKQSSLQHPLAFMYVRRRFSELRLKVLKCTCGVMSSESMRSKTVHSACMSSNVVWWVYR